MRTHKYAWARLNSDAVFVALIFFTVGVFAFVYRDTDAVVNEVGRITFLFTVKNVGFIVGALVMIYALMRAKVAAEVMGRFIILAAAVLDVGRTGIVLGWGGPAAVGTYLLVVILGATLWMRVSVLFRKEGLTFTLPPRVGPGDPPHLEETSL